MEILLILSLNELVWYFSICFFLSFLVEYLSFRISVGPSRLAHPVKTCLSWAFHLCLGWLTATNPNNRGFKSSVVKYFHLTADAAMFLKVPKCSLNCPWPWVCFIRLAFLASLKYAWTPCQLATASFNSQGFENERNIWYNCAPSAYYSLNFIWDKCY